VAFNWELALLYLTKQLFTLKIAQNHEAGFGFC
jgi:hypothetical protein